MTNSELVQEQNEIEAAVVLSELVSETVRIIGKITIAKYLLQGANDKDIVNATKWLKEAGSGAENIQRGLFRVELLTGGC